MLVVNVLSDCLVLYFLNSDFNQLLTESEFITIVIKSETSEGISVEAVILSEIKYVSYLLFSYLCQKPANKGSEE